MKSLYVPRNLCSGRLNASPQGAISAAVASVRNFRSIFFLLPECPWAIGDRFMNPQAALFRAMGLTFQSGDFFLIRYEVGVPPPKIPQTIKNGLTHVLAFFDINRPSGAK
jgi:hypothetical protein